MAGELEIELPNRNLSVQLTYQGESALGSRTGFWVRGCPGSRCLDLLLAADASAKGEVHYYLLPSSRDGDAASADKFDLVGLPTATEDLHRLGLGIPLVVGIEFAAAHQILWRPVHCNFDPEPTSEQWLAHLPGASERSLPATGGDTEEARASGVADAWVWLPRMGLIILEPADRVTAADLLTPPASCHRVREWQSPPQPPVLPERIAGFALWPTSGTEEALSDLASDFGQQAGDLDQAKIEGHPDPSKFESLSSRGQAWLLKQLENWFGDRSSSEQPQPTGKSKLGKTSKKPSRALIGQGKGTRQGRAQGLSWALYQRLSQAIEGQRDKQLRKLLEMTKVDPDEALKYAIPLAGESAFRGLAVPGARLQARLPNYSANAADSSGPADFWGMDHDLQRQLRASYLKMANREVAAGRFRRAAYIYANLLADQAGAAGVLEQGSFYREAAMIYDKLGRESDQARCLLAAGLHEQAVGIFLSKNDYLSAAEAWFSAGREEDARREFHRAVQKLIAEQKVLQAAKLLDEKLQLREEAQDLLWAQWPNGTEALEAASTYFHMLTEQPEVQTANQRLQLAVDLAGSKHLVELSVLCQRIATTFPERSVQSAARDACRVAVATGASGFSAIEMTRALGALQHLDPTDRLLARDAARFKLKWDKTHNRNLPEKRRPKAAQSSSISRLPPLLLAETNCVAFHRVGNSLVVVSESHNLLHIKRYLTPELVSSSVARGGVSAMRRAPPETELRQYVVDELSAVRGRASQQQYSCEWWPLRAILSHSGPNSCDLVLWLDGKKESISPNKVLYEADAQPQALAISTGIPACLELCMAIFRRDRDSWAGLSNDSGDWKLSTCQGNSQNLRSYLLDEPEAPVYELDLLAERAISIPQHTAFLGTLDNALVAAFDNQIVVGAETTTPWAAAVSGQISGISLSPANTRKRIAVAHTAGLDAFWPGSLEAHQLTLSREACFQHALWMQGGRLFAVSDDTLYRYHIRGTQVVSEASIPLLSHEIVGLLELSTGACGVCYRSGIVDRF